MQVTMVKKRLPSGEPCRKCRQAEELLRGRGLWSHIDRVAWAIENDPSSEGMQLAERFGVREAPFFIVDGADAAPRVYRSVLGFLRDGVAPRARREVVTLESRGLDAAAAELEGKPPSEVLRWGLERFGRDCALSFSGAEDVVLIDMAVELGLDFSVFCLDTGRLHPETYRFLDRVRMHYGIELEVVAPEARALQAFVRKKGLFSFYEDGHKECCGVRKVEPLRRVLSGYRAWVTGQRKDQSPATRADVPLVQTDPTFEGRDGTLVKVNPLADWTSSQVWAYIRERDVPFNPLHERGFVSIGCEPCTRATLPGQHEREGRWWWENADDKECGLHAASVAPRVGSGGG